MCRPTRICLSGALFLSAWLTSAPAATLFQTDTFQDGTTQGWIAGAPSPLPPRVLADIGPLGVGDASLLIEAQGGAGAGSRLIAFNLDQWTGNYTAAGITALQADVLNPNNYELVVRFALDGAGGRFTTSEAFTLAPGTGWQRFLWPLQAADLTSVGGANAASTLGNVTELRLLHNPSPSFLGAVADGALLADNITAVPEPSATVLLGALGLLALAARARKRS